jgi:hypothetical protein
MDTPDVEGSIVKTKRGIEYTDPSNKLNHPLFVLNFLNVDKQRKSAAERFWGPSEQQHPLVIWKDPLKGQWMGPDPVLIWGRDFLCIFPSDVDSPCWIPERLVRQHELRHGAQSGG